jgi:hypothetical protein
MMHNSCGDPRTLLRMCTVDVEAKTDLIEPPMIRRAKNTRTPELPQTPGRCTHPFSAQKKGTVHLPVVQGNNKIPEIRLLMHDAGHNGPRQLQSKLLVGLSGRIVGERTSEAER